MEGWITHSGDGLKFIPGPHVQSPPCSGPTPSHAGQICVQRTPNMDMNGWVYLLFLTRDIKSLH